MTLRVRTRFTPEQRFVCQYTGKRSRSRFGVAYAEGVASSGRPCYCIVDQTAGYTVWAKDNIIARDDLTQEDIGLGGFKFREHKGTEETYVIHSITGCVFCVPKHIPDNKGTVSCYAPDGTFGRLAYHLLEVISKEEYDEWSELVPTPIDEPDTTGWRICKDCGNPINPFYDGGHFYCNQCITRRRQEAGCEPDTEWMTGDEFAPWPETVNRNNGFAKKDRVY